LKINFVFNCAAAAIHLASAFMNARLLLPFLVLAACSDDDDGPTITRADVIANHADVVHANYEDALRGAQNLKAKVDAFVAAPSPSRFDAAQRAWLAAREAYGQSEAFRFADGPIDDADGPEGQLNAWPMDEAYLDYVEGAPDAGIINLTSIALTKQSLIGLNAGAMGDVTGIGADFDEETAISTGYHTIEFLLWGQDGDPDGPGTRSWQDFITTGEATAPNGDRRRRVLALAAEILVEDLQGLVAEWAPAGPYRTTWLALPEAEALTKMLSSIGVLAKGELASERIDVALETLDQEDEHSCFSDNTHRDIYLNARGMENLWRGRYEWIDGPGLDELVRQADPAAADALDGAIATSIEAILKVPTPFDQAIRVNGSPGWQAADATVRALFEQADATIGAGTALGLSNISVDLPE
jgi:putative iron-regulated protein